MFNSLQGMITAKEAEKVFLETGGVEWELALSRNSSDSLPGPGETARVYTYLYHREDRMKMYGFAEAAERSLFLDLLSVESIGPSLAMKILSGMQAADFMAALDAENLALLTTIPGLGKKTAQKIILKLKGRLKADTQTEPLLVEITAALIAMGFEPKKAQDAVNQVAGSMPGEGMSREERERELLKSAIASLGNNQA